MLIYPRGKRLLALASVAILFSQACVPAARPQQADVGPQPVARLIIKLHSPADQAAVMRQIRQKLPHPERLTYLREMSTDTHVLSVVAPATAESVTGLIGELLATELFEYVELDRMMTIHGSPQGPKSSQW
jgi:hypothetical protein